MGEKEGKSWSAIGEIRRQRPEHKITKKILEELLSLNQTKPIVEEFKKHGIDTPVIEEGSVFKDKETGAQYASLPFRSSKTGQIHASIESFDDQVQGVYVPLDEKTWKGFHVVWEKEGGAAIQYLPWNALLETIPTGLLSMARSRSSIILKEAENEISHRALYYMGASHVTALNPDIGYYMMVAVCPMAV